MERHPNDDFEWEEDNIEHTNPWARLLTICAALAIWGGIAWAMQAALK